MQLWLLGMTPCWTASPSWLAPWSLLYDCQDSLTLEGSTQMIALSMHHTFLVYPIPQRPWPLHILYRLL